MHIGMKESEARSLVRTALSAAGLENLDSITLFGREYSIQSTTKHILALLRDVLCHFGRHWLRRVEKTIQ